MSRAPTTTVVADRTKTSSATRRSCTRALRPPSDSLTNAPAPVANVLVDMPISPGNRETSRALANVTAANRVKTSAGSERTSRRLPAISGPLKIATFSASPETALAAVRSAGAWVMLGRITAWTGLVIVKLTHATVATAMVSGTGACP